MRRVTLVGRRYSLEERAGGGVDVIRHHIAAATVAIRQPVLAAVAHAQCAPARRHPAVAARVEVAMLEVLVARRLEGVAHVERLSLAVCPVTLPHALLLAGAAPRRRETRAGGGRRARLDALQTATGALLEYTCNIG